MIDWQIFKKLSQRNDADVTVPKQNNSDVTPKRTNSNHRKLRINTTPPKLTNYTGSLRKGSR